MYSRQEMLDRKRRIDERSAELKLTLREWRREAAATGVFRTLEEVAELEREIVSLGHRSNKIQGDISLLKSTMPDGNHWFAVAAKELLTDDEFRLIADHATSLRKAAMEANGHGLAPRPAADEESRIEG